MSIVLLLLLQLAAATPVAAPDSSPDYATAALRGFVERAAAVNRRVPIALRGYEAAVESEIGIVARPTGDAEAVVSVEQLASRVRWRRSGDFEQRVVGYRSQAAALNLSALSWLDQGWVIPSLYGNRMALFFGRDSARTRADGGRDSARTRAGEGRDSTRRRGDGTRRQDRRRVAAVHPFAEDRDRVYRFAGGDTVATVRVSGREIPIVRVRVEPRSGLPARTFVFRGEVHVDAARHHIVRMRGQFLVTGGRPSVRERIARQAFQALAFVELENQEVGERYWVPAFQRVELQGSLGPFADTRGGVRIVSRVRDVVLDEDAVLAASVAASAPDVAGAPLAADTLVPSPHRLVVAPRDSLERFGAWQRALGAETAAASGDDFLDVAPDRLRPTGPPRVEPWGERTSDVFRYNRIEGAFTGVGARLRLRDRLPGATLAATAGWAWSERAVRGRARAELRRGPWTTFAAAGRTLDLTNDFPTLFDSGSTIAALFGRDDYDYVDRRWAAAGVGRDVGRLWRVRAETGPARDAMAEATVARGPFGDVGGFRPNRPVLEGRYWRSALRLDVAPAVRADLVRPGVGGTLRWTRGDGGPTFDRLEARVEARRQWGPWTGTARAEGGLVRGDPLPPQQLFELGGGERLAGYAYKAFAGDRAALFGGQAMYALPVLRAPLRVRVPGWRAVWLPSPAPALSAGIEGGWAGASSDAARLAVRALGDRVDPTTGALVPVSRPAGRTRLSVDARLRLFGGALSLGVARALERGEPWRLVIGTGQ